MCFLATKFVFLSFFVAHIAELIYSHIAELIYSHIAELIYSHIAELIYSHIAELIYSLTADHVEQDQTVYSATLVYRKQQYKMP